MHFSKLVLGAMSLLLAGFSVGAAHAQSLGETQVTERRQVKPPPGFRAACGRYQWLCGEVENDASGMKPTEALDVALKINRRVNRSVSELSDPENYGVADYWATPRNGRGDCEDFVLQKYKLLLEAGVDPRSMSIAVVRRRGENHAVLVLHHTTGDLVMDSLSRSVVPWNRTGYRFLAMQSRDQKDKWEIVAGHPKSSEFLALR